MRALLLTIVFGVVITTPLLAQARPDPHLTPGAVATSDTAVICRRKTGTVRNVPASRKDSAYALYHRHPVPRHCCEVDHLIPLELGGANSLDNLWPQPWGEARRKDVLENRLHRLVCLGRLPVVQAQLAIARDWVAALRRWPTN